MSSTPTLDERIAAAEADLASATTFTGRYRAGRTLDELNAAKLAGLIARTNPATGRIEPEPAAPTLAVAPENETGTTLAPGSLDGGARAHKPTNTLDDQIREAEAQGDWKTASHLNAIKLGQAFARQRAVDLGAAI